MAYNTIIRTPHESVKAWFSRVKKTLGVRFFERWCKEIPTSGWHEYTKQGGTYHAVDRIYGKLYQSYITGEPSY